MEHGNINLLSNFVYSNLILTQTFLFLAGYPTVCLPFVLSFTNTNIDNMMNYN